MADLGTSKIFGKLTVVHDVEINGVFIGDGSGLANVDAATLDGLDSAQFLRSDQNTEITGNLVASAFVSKTDAGQIIYHPDGGHFRKTGTGTGAIKVALPVSWSSDMITMRIEVFNYSSNDSFSLNCAGYNYNSGTPTWYNESAYIVGPTNGSVNHTVRFGHDGTKCCIYIGETNTTWGYLGVVVSEIHVTDEDSDTWREGWNISLATSFGTITDTRTNTHVGKYIDGNSIWHAGNDSTLIKTDEVSQTIDSGGDNTSLTIQSGDGGNATLNVMGNGAQGTGRLYVGQSNSHGGGIEYNGDSTPATTGAPSDKIVFWRRTDGIDSWTAYYSHDDSTWGFKVTPNVGGDEIWHAGNDGTGSGLDADMVDGHNITVSETPPSNPQTNDIWFDIS